MAAIPSVCDKCLGFTCWDEEEIWRCVNCGKRFFSTPLPLSPFEVLEAFVRINGRTPRDPVYHADYMRRYMREYRAKKKLEEKEKLNGHCPRRD